jgi:hypothetical protein
VAEKVGFEGLKGQVGIWFEYVSSKIQGLPKECLEEVEKACLACMRLWGPRTTKRKNKRNVVRPLRGN